MSYYLRFTESDETPMSDGAAEEWLEVDLQGVVRRELSFDGDGHVVHQFPSTHFPHGSYGYFDLAPFETKGLVNDIDPAEFETRWKQATLETANRPTPPDAMDRLIARVTHKFRPQQ
jgi:hypothetical protein